VTGGCGGLAYYAQAIDGHAQIMHRTTPIGSLLARADLPDGLRDRLELALEVRAFASRELGLPDNDSYREYVDLGREAMVWSLVATPEFALAPVQWCYPVVGCATYRGYFDEGDAREAAARLAGDGLDVSVDPVAAYSTLGWFDDPLPSTVLGWSDPDLAGLIIHELAHQRLYVEGDTPFNEAFATAVARAGVGRWLRERGDRAAEARWEVRQLHRQAFVALVARTQARLREHYARPLPAEALRRLKRGELERLRRDYGALSAGWAESDGLDAWFERPLNNARLAAVGTYEEWVPAFLRLLCEQGGDLPAFYRAAEVLGGMDAPARGRRLDALRRAAAGGQASRRSCR
jgi:predicted aminopeptidase